MSNSFLVIVGLGLFLGSAALVRLFCYYAVKQGLIAIPNARSSHQVATPLGAGVVFVLLWFLCLLVGNVYHLFSVHDLLLFVPSTLVVSLVGFWDDHRELSARKRLLVQVLVAIFCVIMLGDVTALHLSRCTTLPLGWAGLVLTVLSIAWSINLYNFMDGIDGLAGVEALFVFGIGGFFFWHVGAIPLALLTWTLVATVAGFLVWNWPKASVFMGTGNFPGAAFVAFHCHEWVLFHLKITSAPILPRILFIDCTEQVIRTRKCYGALLH